MPPSALSPQPSALPPKRIALVAGEASGDLLGAELIPALRARLPGVELAGIGGPRMRGVGFSSWFPMEPLSVMGLAEVLRHLPELLRLRASLVRRLRVWRPDVFVGIDAPDFNLGVAKRLKRAGLRTVHYVSPSVWAWRAGRARRIGAAVDRVLCLFPMEPPIYAAHGVDARFVGHPLADRLPRAPDRAAARAALGIPHDAPVLAVLPGSRLGEISRLGSDFAAATRALRARHPALVVLAPMATRRCAEAFRVQLAAAGIEHDVRLLEGEAHAAMTAANVVLLASGTAALEAALLKRPMVVAYRLNTLTYRVVKTFKLLKVDRYALPNVLAGESLVPEILQDEVSPESLAAAVDAWLTAPARVSALTARFDTLHATLAQDASARAAEAIAELAERTP